jgi:hypothetical protein
MIYENLILPKDKNIGTKSFIISKIPALIAQTAVYPNVVKSLSENGAVGLTMLPSAVVKTILRFVALRKDDGTIIVLDSDEKIGEAFNENFSLMSAVVSAMCTENFGFLTDGSLREVLGEAAAETE